MPIQYFQRPVDPQSVAYNGNGFPGSDQPRFSDGGGKGFFRHLPAKGAVKVFVFEEKNGIGVLRRCHQKSLGVGRESRIQNFQSGRFNEPRLDRKSTRLNSSHVKISYAVFCLKKKQNTKYYL